MEPSEGDINELRSSFLKKCEEENVTGSGTFHIHDVNRAKTDDDWLRRFLIHQDNDQKEALNMMMETCDWRKKCGVNGKYSQLGLFLSQLRDTTHADVTEKSVNPDLLDSGGIFPYGKDRDGKSILIFKSKTHVKGAYPFDDLKMYLIYWMERMERQERGQMISIFFDMDGAGFSNMDMDYTKYIISLFKNYYPRFLNYIIIFEMPWILNAAFKLIKSWLPPKAIKKLKFHTKSTLKDVVDPEVALKCWGGKSDFVYTFTPEERSQDATPVHEEMKKKVHFAESTPQENLGEGGFPESSSTNPFNLSVSPPDMLSFSYEGNEITGVITLKNENSECVSYKIKTTSPKKFRVRPSTGILHPNKSTTITVVMQPGYELPGLSRDKFLIMSLVVDATDLTAKSLLDKWKDVSEKDVGRHRLKCSFFDPSKTDGALVNGSAFGTHSVDDQKITKLTCDMLKLKTTVSSLREDVKSVQRQQWIIATAILFLACIIAFLSGSMSGHPSGDRNCLVTNASGN